MLGALLGWSIRTRLSMRLKFLLVTQTGHRWSLLLVHDDCAAILSQYQLIQPHLVLLLVHDLILDLSGLLLLGS